MVICEQSIYRFGQTMSKTIPICRRCKAELNEENWYPSLREGNNYICKPCYIAARRKRRHANREKARLESEKDRRRRGVKSMQDNKACAKWLGVHVAEQVLQRVFKNVTPMPHDNPGFDFICGQGYKVDVKSSCIRPPAWVFSSRKNQTADYFLCLAFDNRDNLNPLYLWLIPGELVEDHYLVSISESRLEKWNEYKLNINNTISNILLTLNDIMMSEWTFKLLESENTGA